MPTIPFNIITIIITMASLPTLIYVYFNKSKDNGSALGIFGYFIMKILRGKKLK